VNIYTKWPMKEDTRKYLRQLAMASSIGFQLVFAIFIGLFIGVWLDKLFGTGHKLALIFMVMGIIAGFLNYYRYARKEQEEESKDSKR
jgi:ATP synthase protein I